MLQHQRLRGGGKTVHTPSYTSAAIPIDSPSVGCGWMVLPMSVPSQPISMARAISQLHRSPVARVRADDGAAYQMFNRGWIIKNPAIACGVFSVTTSALARRRQVRAHAFVHFGALLPTYRSIHPASGAGGWSCRCRRRRSPFRWPARFRRFIVHLSPACVPTTVLPVRCLIVVG